MCKLCYISLNQIHDCNLERSDSLFAFEEDISQKSTFMKKATIKYDAETGEAEGVNEFCDKLDIKQTKMQNGLARTMSMPGITKNRSTIIG